MIASVAGGKMAHSASGFESDVFMMTQRLTQPRTECKGGV